ncbi:hypothetical protein LTR17_024763 [Elasticomyces elasticus]|nr:hypothetical protein LTR17_024763 [Elasticomyces elasticus]
MHLSSALLLLLPYLTFAARFHYAKDCEGASVTFGFPGNQKCVRLESGFARSLFWNDSPGIPLYAVAYKKGANSACGTSRCNINALQSKDCCNSPIKDIKGAERYAIQPGPGKRSTLGPRGWSGIGRDVEADDGSQEDCVSVWEVGGVLSVAVGDRTIEVPNHNSTAPTEEEVRDALVNAGVEDVDFHLAQVGAELEF